jgi:uncharacterized protein (TIGR03437 family)
VYTDQDGVASVTVTPLKEGAVKLTAKAGTLSVNFSLTATAPPIVLTPASLAIVDGDAQTAVVGTPFAKALKCKVTASTGTAVPAVQVAFALATGQAALSAQAATTDQNGEASITVTPSMVGPISITATAGALSATFKLTAISADTPKITPGGVVQQGYSTPPVTSISTGAIVTIYGDNFAAKGSAAVFGAATGGTLATKLAAVCVYFGDTPAPIFALVPTQVTVQVPKVAPGRVSVQVSRYCGESGELKSNVETVTAQAATPEFVYVKFNADGKNPIAAADSVTGQWIGEAAMLPGVNTRPAKPGDYLTLYGVGFGDTSPAVLPGQAATGVAWITGKAQVSIGGVALSDQDVLYIGFSPGLIGLYQLNLKVPAGIPSGNQPVSLRIGDAGAPAGGFITIAQ